MSRTGRTILIATLGKTPQVLVETVWALANGETPIVPDEIVAISTGNYAEVAEARLLGQGGAWNLLLKELKKIRVPMRGKLRFDRVVVARDENGMIQDLRSQEDNVRCANFLFRLVRSYADRTTSDRLVVSLSGGRKSLSALVTAVMSLLARPGDRLVHLIADESMEDNVCHFLRGARGYSLFDVPFVRVRGLIAGVKVSEVSTFEKCLELTQERVEGVREFPQITLDAATATFAVDRREDCAVFAIDGSRFLFLWLLFKLKRLDADLFIRLMCKAHELQGVVNAPGWFRRFQNKADKFVNCLEKGSATDFRKVKHEAMRDVIQRSGLTEMQALSLYPRMKNGKPVPSESAIAYPEDCLQVKDTSFTKKLEEILFAEDS
jgi:CRISPR-associated protein (TIGR02584 family)